MADHLSVSKRSWNMSKIRNKNTVPEKAVRSMLHEMGFRFRLHQKDLPGKPDIVLSKFKTAIFVNGCFWHRHGCKRTTMPGTNTEFWSNKFNRTIKRDNNNYIILKNDGWRVIVLWECQVKETNKIQSILSNLFNNV